MIKSGKLLRLVMVLVGLSELPALGAVFLPIATMDAIHRWLGLGPLPAGPIVEYLARSLSLFYAMQGGLFLLAATDLRRYSGLVYYLGGSMLLLGVVVLGIDLSAGLPAWWTWGEGCVTLATGLAVLALNRLAGPRSSGMAEQRPPCQAAK
jgi:hypothetical protein